MSDYSSLFVLLSAETLNSSATSSPVGNLHYTLADMKGYTEELYQLLGKVNCAQGGG